VRRNNHNFFSLNAVFSSMICEIVHDLTFYLLKTILKLIFYCN
jgi:hypothetical protein